MICHLDQRAEMCRLRAEAMMIQSSSIIGKMVFILLCFKLTLADSSPVAGQVNYDSIYCSLVAETKKDCKTADYTALRMAYSKLSFFEPYETDAKLNSSMLTAYNKGDYEEAIFYAATILDMNYTDTDAHFLCWDAYGKTGDRERSKFHQTVVEGIIGSVLASGDGKTYETAYKIVRVREEYAVLYMSGFKVQNQILIEHEGHLFDKLEVVNVDTGDTDTIYFNIDAVFAWYGNKK